MHILFLSYWFPYPTSNGSKLRIYNLLKGLTAHHDVTLLTFAEEADARQPVEAIASICRRLDVVPRQKFAPDSLQARVGYFSKKPRSIVNTYSREMAKRIRHSLISEEYDVIIASQIGTAVYSNLFRSIPALFEEIELGVLFEQYSGATTVRTRLRNWLTWYKHQHYLRDLLRNFAAGTVVSDRERELVLDALPGCNSIEVIPNCVNLEDYREVREVPEAGTLIFTGPFSYQPNYEAMVWFLRKVYPLIQEHVPAVKLSITGDHKNLPLPSSTNVTLTGFVDDIRPLVARSWVSLAPLQEGGGTRLKILEAMALQSPVVATSKGAEGLDVESGKHLLIADTPEAFAQSVVGILCDRTLHKRLTENAYELIKQKYDWKKTTPCFLDLVSRTAGG